jgi:hypothetical protein
MGVLNDLLAIAYRRNVLHLENWSWIRTSKHKDDIAAVSSALVALRKQLPDLVNFVQNTAVVLAGFDWRLSSAMPQNDGHYFQQASYRGSGGYSLLRRNLLIHLRDNATEPISDFSSEVIDIFGYEEEES